MIVFSKTPYRISLIGGGTDTSKWFDNNIGHTLSFSIDKHCYISVRDLSNFFGHKYRLVYSKIEQVNNINQIKHPSIREVLNYSKTKGGLEIHHDGDLPARSGIGSSSAFTVGMLNAINAFNNKKIGKLSLAKKSIYIEQNLIRENVGCQDQLACSLGGLNFISYQKGNKFKINRIKINKTNLKLLQDNSLLLFTDISRNSSNVQKKNFSNYKLIDKNFHEMNILSKECFKEFQRKKLDLKSIGNIIDGGWELKNKISRYISNKLINEIMNEISTMGIYGQKLIGAGGGGFIYILANKEAQKKIKKKFLNNLTFNFKLDFEGSKIIFKS